jgi:hypothetical protein
MSDENKDWRSEWNATLFNSFRSLKFVLSIIFETVTAAAIVWGIKMIQQIVTPELTIVGWQIHQIALVFEEIVLIAFFVSSLIKHFSHLFEDQIGWVISWTRGKRP